MDTLLPAIAHAAFDRLKAVLDNLGAAPPQVLLLEGGSEAQRMDTARYWAMRINCPTAGATGTAHRHAGSAHGRNSVCRRRRRKAGRCR